jgi:hypothetical protein
MKQMAPSHRPTHRSLRKDLQGDGEAPCFPCPVRGGFEVVQRQCTV